MSQSCLHIEIKLIFYGHLNLTKICHICSAITGQYLILQHSAKNVEIQLKRTTSVSRLEIPHSAEN